MSEDANKTKRKISWWRITGLGLLAIFIASFVAHAIWTIHESHVLDRKIAIIQSRHEPILPSDFAASDIDPNNDAVTAVRDAAASLKLDDATSRRVADLDMELPLAPQEKQMFETALERVQASLDAVDAAQGTPMHNWGVDASAADASHLIAIGLPSVQQFRALAQYLQSSALFEHERKNDRAAMERIVQILFVADVLDQYPSLVTHLVAIGCRAIAASTIAQVTPDLNIGSGDQSASVADVRRAIELLLDDSRSRDGYRRALSGERMFELAMAHLISDGSPGQSIEPMDNTRYYNRSSITQYAFRPIVYRNADMMLDYTSAALGLADKANLPAARAGLPPQIQFSFMTMFARILLPGFDRTLEAHFRGLTDQHLAATVLALRCYAVDHGGKLPPKLDELVPAYVAAVPVDPMAADGRPIAYRIDGDSPIVYSIGTNGVDDGGSESPLPKAYRTHGKVDPWSMLDRVVHLTRQPRSIEGDDHAAGAQ